MLKIKRLHTFMLQTFLPLFFMTFGICLFIVLMQFLWRNIDDMVGKGLGIAILGEMFFYAALYLVPMALPLAILLSSLMTFGNLGERLELLAMKSAGVSLFNIMRPLTITIGFICFGAFFYQNYAMPVINVKFYTMLYSFRQKSPELDIPEGVFYSGITGYNVYIRHKNPDNGQLRDLMIYDYSKGFNNASVMVADSGRLKVSADKMFLVLSLYNGESFQNLDKQQQDNTKAKGNVPYQRETFSYREILIEFDANFERTDESLMQNQFMAKNLHDLQTFIDSVNVRLDSIRGINAEQIYAASYRRTLDKERAKQNDAANQPSATASQKEMSTNTTSKQDDPAPVIQLNYDSIYQASTPNELANILSRAKSSIDNTRADYFFKAATLGEEAYKFRRHNTEWHKKFTVSFACLVFFFIGAPLGAIIRKGGLGTPVVLSVILFIFYYIIDNIGFKMARDGVWNAWQGMWLSSAILTPLGVFLTYKAVNDSAILNADTYINALKNLFDRKSGRKIEHKELIIFAPDYPKLVDELKTLADQCEAYLAQHKRWTHYLRFWQEGGCDPKAEALANKVEQIVEELSNADHNLVLNKLMDYPIMSGYHIGHNRLKGEIGQIIALFFPIGLPIYLFATYQRKLLLHNIGISRKTSMELIDIIENLHLSLSSENKA